MDGSTVLEAIVKVAQWGVRASIDRARGTAR